MDTRSTAAGGYTHFLGDVWSGVGSSHGVALQAGSTGGIVQAVGDDANVALNLLPKGSGPLILGSSGTPVFTGGSTTPFSGYIRLSTDITTPTIASTDVGSTYSTVTVPGGNSSHFVVINSRNLSTAYALGEAAFGSTANELNIKFVKASTVAGAGSTFTLNILVYRF
jgi:hypothetical protein